MDAKTTTNFISLKISDYFCGEIVFKAESRKPEAKIQGSGIIFSQIIVLLALGFPPSLAICSLKAIFLITFVATSAIPLRKNILFIINPISGGKDKAAFPDLARKCLDTSKFQGTFTMTEGSGHATEVATEALSRSIDVVVAVGGDGTINEVASVMANSPATMGIIPCGSGNGLARSLGIPMNIRKAVERLNQPSTRVIDTGLLNGRRFFNMAGVGFDAHICSIFAHDQTRGFRGYARTAFSEIVRYKAQDYRLDIDGRTYDREGFMISIANSSQFGNNAHVSPSASLDDGLLDVCIVKPFPLHHFPVMGYHMFSNTADRSKYVEIIKGKQITITRGVPGPVHLDGEPVQMGESIRIELLPLSLRILT